MTAKAVKPRNGNRPVLPVVTNERVREDESRRMIEAAFSPWRVQRWVDNDFGIDAVIELTQQRSGTDDHYATGRLFAVQLKATHSADPPTTLRVDAKHLRYWRIHSLPVLVVLADTRRNALWGWWITQELVRSSVGSPTQETATLHTKDALAIEPSALAGIETSVLRMRGRPPVVDVSRYLALRTRVEGHIRSFNALADETRLNSLLDLARQIRSSLRTNPYTVAITGPQRVGKSTLSNALMRAAISPVADYPTTAVPISFICGETATARVIHEDGKCDTVAPTADALRPFAAQQENVANSKRVRLIEVELPSETLARGLSLVDTPGLHDASETVRLTARAALDLADAVVYVLDASLANKFRLTAHEVEDLQQLRGKESLLLLLNQSDAIDAARRESLLEYVGNTLRLYGLTDLLARPPLFVSGLQAWEAVDQQRDPPLEFLELEDALWGTLLRTRSTGFDRLRTSIDRLLDGCDQCKALLEQRSTAGDQATGLSRARTLCVLTLAKVQRDAKEWQDNVYDAVARALRDYTAREASRFDSELAKVPTGEPLPDAAKIRTRLEATIGSMLCWVPRFLDERSNELAEQLTTRVADALKSFRAELGMPPPMTIGRMEPPSLSFDLSLPEAERGFVVGLLGFLVNPVVGAISTAVAWLAGHDLAVKRRHAKHVAQASKHYRDALVGATASTLAVVLRRLASVARLIGNDAKARLETFVDDAAVRIETLGKPLEPTERRRLTIAKNKTIELQQILLDDAALMDALR